LTQHSKPAPKNLRLKGANVIEGVLRLFRLPIEYFDGDLESFVVYLAIVAANFSRFRRGPERLLYADENYPPAEERLPVSRRAVAESVGFPRETVRRKIAELIDKGHVIQVRGGLVAVPPVLEQGRNREMVLDAIKVFERVATELRQSDAL
jgi:hypothetical protein